MSLVSENYQRSLLSEADVRAKIRQLPADIEKFWAQHNICWLPETPCRDIKVMQEPDRRKRKGLSDREEQGRLLHNLANIELQAMELAFRSYVEYPEAHTEFREQLAELAISESEHLQLCLEQLQELGYQWGDWPIHLNLWAAVSKQDSLLDRLLIVHRYLEACGLDSGVALLNRLHALDAPHVKKAVSQIADDEVGHVEFGSRWYRFFCQQQNLEASDDFPVRLQMLKSKLPKRIEKLQCELRKNAGFTEAELQAAENLRQEFMATARGGLISF